jgi:pyruvate/2-oxoglutarate/acetoin dehydrogenase E1 component
MAELTYLQAISDALRTEMRRNEKVFVIGEDVGVYGGAFKVTLGFQEEFGPWRVIDAPLAETAIVGAATGAAMMGMRPVAEMQFADFVSCAWDHLVTIAAKQHLYRRIKAQVPEERYTTPIGKARTHREGRDISVVTWGAMVYTADEAAKQLEGDGISVEIVDLRTVMPWDKAAVLETVRKTSKLLVLHEDTHTGGFGAEIAATVAEEAFEDLDGPVRRIAAPDTPVPFSPPLEKAFIPQVDDVVAGLRELAEY